MSTPALAHREPDPSTVPRSSTEPGDWRFATWTLATVALLLWVGNQVAHVVLTREGPQYVCSTRSVPDRARALGAVDQGHISGESTFIPPTFVCGYPTQGGGQPVIFVDMYPAGPWIFWISLSVLALTTVLAFVLRRWARA